MTISLFGVSFHSYNYVKKSIDSILETASESINFTVVDNYSDWSSSGTEQIREMLREYVAAGKIKRSLFMNGNYFGWGLVEALKAFLVKDADETSFFMMTDLDLIVPSNCDWIKETRQAHESGAVLTGFGLDTSNYLPPNDGYSEYGFGLHGLAVNRELYINKFGIDNNTIDANLISTFLPLGKVLKLGSRLYHQTWNVFEDDPVYAAEKQKLGVSWVHRSKPDNISYELVENS